MTKLLRIILSLILHKFDTEMSLFYLARGSSHLHKLHINYIYKLGCTYQETFVLEETDIEMDQVQPSWFQKQTAEIG